MKAPGQYNLKGWATATQKLPADLAAKVRLYVLWVDDESDRSV